MLAGCSNAPSGPGCNEALTHYYAAGCAIQNPSNGANIPINVLIDFCESAPATASSTCVDDRDVWLTCSDSVPLPVASAGECDCMQTYAALLVCR